MGETRVDLLHLLEDLRDAYAGTIEETILTELVANALDSGATRIAVGAELSEATLTLTDDGTGMTRRELRRYHDIAASSKVRGQGIGFAGVGVKLALLLCEEVVTETRRGTSHVATSWRLSSRHRAPWRWTPPAGWVAERGTAVRLRLQNPLSPLLDPGFIETALRTHFEPLLDEAFGEILAERYPRIVRFAVNGSWLPRRPPSEERAHLALRIGRRRRPSGVGFLRRGDSPLPEGRRGVAVSTLGKVIKRGWDWLGLTPAAADRITGLIEVPELAGCLTLDKGDFIRSGARGATYLAYRKAIQEAVASQLAAWGDGAEAAPAARRRARPLERDLRILLVDLAAEFPLLAALVEPRPGGQRRLPAGARSDGRVAADGALPGAATAVADLTEDGLTAEAGAEAASSDEVHEPADDANDASQTARRLPGPPAAGHGAPKRRGHYGLTIQFENRPEQSAMARLIESTVWINEAHPAYGRAVASRSEGYHLALAVAMALATLAVEPAQAQAFLGAFLAHWGEGAQRPARRR